MFTQSFDHTNHATVGVVEMPAIAIGRLNSFHTEMCTKPSC